MKRENIHLITSQRIQQQPFLKWEYMTGLPWIFEVVMVNAYCIATVMLRNQATFYTQKGSFLSFFAFLCCSEVYKILKSRLEAKSTNVRGMST